MLAEAGVLFEGEVVVGGVVFIGADLRIFRRSSLKYVKQPGQGVKARSWS